MSYRLVEVIQRHSKNYAGAMRVRRLAAHLRELGLGGDGSLSTRLPVRSQSAYQPHKLSQRLTTQTVAAIVADYQAGATTRELGQRFGLAHSSVNKLLKQGGVTLRRRGPRKTDIG